MTPAATPPPRTEAQLMRNVEAIAGLTLAQVAATLERDVPTDPVHAKGWAGQLIEHALGASAGSLAEPDFQLIGVELKTIPIDAQGAPAESTYVCTVDLEHAEAPRWELSLVRHKLARVLWLPIESAPQHGLGQRRIGMGLLWSPSTQQEQALREDWEELMDLVYLGQVESITAHHGQYLQIRPKAANAAARRYGVNERGERALTLPRGFYLRAAFTRRIIDEGYAGKEP